jgi:predicted O-methyltransferase YrrM
MQIPSRVAALRRRAVESNFPFSSEDSTGALLAVLAASVRPGGRICELGTGLGVGLGWIVGGLEPRSDVFVVTIENDLQRSALAREADWPEWVQFVTGDATVELPQLGRFDLIFADAEGGKWYGLDVTLAALGLGGMLVLDDLVPQDWKSDADRQNHRQKMDEIRTQVYGDPDLVVTELTDATGVLLAVRRGASSDA